MAMQNKNLHLIFLISQVALIYSAIPPLQKCSLPDSSCLKNSAQLVLPSFVEGIESKTEVLDPMHVKHIDVDLSGLKLTITNAEIIGLKGTKIDDLSIDMAGKKMELVLQLDTIELQSNYKASGKLLVLPISGDGRLTIRLTNTAIRLTSHFEIIKKNGKDTLSLKSYKYTYDIKDNAFYDLTNLFNGNKELSDTMLKFMNENWKTLTLEFGTPVLDQPINKIFTSIRNYIKSQPLEDIAVL